MRTAGIDLSADPKKTGVAVVDWDADGAATVARLDVGGARNDNELVDLMGTVDKTGIDCPLGWPSPFIDYLVAHRAGGHDLIVPATRRPLSLRTTDIHVKDVTGIQPLSVAADRIGAAAMRCAALLSALTVLGTVVDRTGQTGPVVEVYPAAALKIWGLPHQGYKGNEAANQQRRLDLVESVSGRFPWLDLGPHAGLCRASDDALDAVLCAITAGLAVRGETVPPPDDLIEVAAAEGWIALPQP